MSFNKFKSNSYCVGGKHYSATTNIKGDITTHNKKTWWISKTTLWQVCNVCKRKKALLVSDQPIAPEELGNFFSSLGFVAENVGKKMLNDPGRALELAANISSAAASKNPKLISTAPDFIKFVHQGYGLYPGKIHWWIDAFVYRL